MLHTPLYYNRCCAARFEVTGCFGLIRAHTGEDHPSPSGQTRRHLPKGAAKALFIYKTSREGTSRRLPFFNRTRSTIFQTR